MRNLILVILTLAFFAGCQQENVEYDYDLVKSNGIYVEKFDTLIKDEDRYTSNNKVFKPGRVFVYEYYLEKTNGEKYAFQSTKDAARLPARQRLNSWNLVHTDSLTDISVEKVLLKVRPGLQPFIEHFPDYDQTIIEYHYVQRNNDRPFNEATGVIENEKNVWLHPPRSNMFRVLELNPFPFVQAPYEIGNTWQWSLKIGDAWSDKRWKKWDGQIENQYQYEITDIRSVETAIGELECIEISASAKSRIGQTHLVSYFNKEHGFVKLNYTNIDSTRLILEIQEIREEEF